MSTQFAPVWNNASVDFSCIKANVTDTNSGSNSTLLDLQIGGSSKFKVSKNGSLVLTDANSSVTTGNGYLKFGSVFYSVAVDGTDVFCFAGRDAVGNPLNGAIVRSTSVIGFSSGSPLYNTVADLTLCRDAANTLAQRNGTSAQALRLYKTWANNGVDYERGVLDWQTTADVLRIGTEAGGTGTVRNIALVGGNVGIGTTSPGAPLHVVGSVANVDNAIISSGTGRVDFRIKALSTNNAANLLFGHGASTYWNISSNNDGGTKSLFFCQEGANYTNAVMAVQQNGNVGIGLTSPAAKLDISDTTGAGSGSLQASALNIAQTWNTTGTPTAIKLNVTDTASNAASLLMDLQVGGSSRFKINKAGRLNISGGGGGSATDVDIGYAGSTTYGILFGNGVRCVANGVISTWSSPSGLQVNGAVAWTDAGATGNITAQLVQDAFYVLALRNGTNANTFRIYNTTDAGLTNYERAKIAWESNVLWFGYEYGGTGNQYRKTRLGRSIGYFEQSDNQGLNATWSSSSSFSQTLWLNGNIQFSVGSVTNFVGMNTSGSNRFTFADTVNIEFATTTGTKIGTATTQKLGFYNATPVVQPAAVADATDAASVITQLNLLLARMRDLGLIAT